MSNTRSFAPPCNEPFRVPIAVVTQEYKSVNVDAVTRAQSRRIQFMISMKHQSFIKRFDLQITRLLTIQHIKKIRRENPDQTAVRLEPIRVSNEQMLQ